MVFAELNTNSYKIFPVIIQHSIGRGGRFGRKGAAINFVTPDDERNLKDIMSFYGTEIVEMPADVADLL